MLIPKSAIIEIRQRLEIPIEGLGEREALTWCRMHFSKVKGKSMQGTFGFEYDSSSGLVDFKYESSPYLLQIYSPQPLDSEVPLDREALALRKELNIPVWAGPALRLVILVGEIHEGLELQLPDHMMTPLGGFRVLVHPITAVSLKQWRKTGEMMGLLWGRTDMWKFPCSVTSYYPVRKNRKESLYWQTLLAYIDAVTVRWERGQKGGRGLLVETAQILKEDYGWECPPDSYIVRRYLDRAEKIWHGYVSVMEHHMGLRDGKTRKIC